MAAVCFPSRSLGILAHGPDRILRRRIAAEFIGNHVPGHDGILCFGGPVWNRTRVYRLSAGCSTTELKVRNGVPCQDRTGALHGVDVTLLPLS